MNTDAKILNKILPNYKILAEFSNTSKNTMIKLGLVQGCKDSSIYTNQSV